MYTYKENLFPEQINRLLSDSENIIARYNALEEFKCDLLLMYYTEPLSIVNLLSLLATVEKRFSSINIYCDNECVEPFLKSVLDIYGLNIVPHSEVSKLYKYKELKSKNLSLWVKAQVIQNCIKSKKDNDNLFLWFDCDITFVRCPLKHLYTQPNTISYHPNHIYNQFGKYTFKSDQKRLNSGIIFFAPDVKKKMDIDSTIEKCKKEIDEDLLDDVNDKWFNEQGFMCTIFAEGFERIPMGSQVYCLFKFHAMFHDEGRCMKGSIAICDKQRICTLHMVAGSWKEMLGASVDIMYHTKEISK